MSTNQSLIFTQNAANKVFELIKQEGNFDLNLRVFIMGGGCSGFQYGFTFDEAIDSEDQIIEQSIEGSGSVKLLVDKVSYGYLEGAEIDYKSDVEGDRFVIRNPNAKTTCGCGSSFSA